MVGIETMGRFDSVGKLGMVMEGMAGRTNGVCEGVRGVIRGESSGVPGESSRLSRTGSPVVVELWSRISPTVEHGSSTLSVFALLLASLLR